MIDDYLNISLASKSLNNQGAQILSNIYNQGNVNRTPLAPVSKEVSFSSMGCSW